MLRFLTPAIAIVLGATAARPASASEPDISLTCTNQEGRDGDVKIYMAERRLEVNGESHGIAEAGGDRIVSETYRGGFVPGMSSIYREYTWTIWRATLKFELASVSSSRREENNHYYEGVCSRAAAQF